MKRGIFFGLLAALVAVLLWALAGQIHGRQAELTMREAFLVTEAAAARRNLADVRRAAQEQAVLPVAAMDDVPLDLSGIIAPCLTGEGFDFALFAEMPQSENFVVSPLSLKMALALAANGAGGKTLRELLTALDADSLDALNRTLADVLARAEGAEDIELNIANSIWFNRDRQGGALRFAEEYTARVAEQLTAEAALYGGDDGAERINRWVADKTGGKITEPVSDRAVRSSLSVLVNAVYFNGTWAIPFSEEDTEEGVFTHGDGTLGTAEYMQLTAYFPYYADARLRMLSLPYQGGGYEMTLVLPEPGCVLTDADIRRATEGLEQRRVRLKLPKFQIESTHEALMEQLMEQGIHNLFDPRYADLSGMYSEPPAENPFVAEIVQKAVIEVDETGTEAAAATAVLIPTSAPMGQPEAMEFFCDRPFFYFVREAGGGEILFFGRYAYAGGEPPVTLTVQPESVTPEGASFVLENRSGRELYYGEPYHLERKRGGEWEAVELANDGYFVLPAYLVPTGESRTLTRSYSFSYGPLPPGEYRFVTDISIARIQGGYDHTTLYAPFAVE